MQTQPCLYHTFNPPSISQVLEPPPGLDMDSEFDFTSVEMEGRYQISPLRSWKVCGFELTRTWIPAQHPEDAPEGSITRFRPNREVNNPIPIFRSSLEHRLWWKNNPVTCLWLRSSCKEPMMFPSPQWCLVCRDPWERSWNSDHRRAPSLFGELKVTGQHKLSKERHKQTPNPGCLQLPAQ